MNYYIRQAIRHPRELVEDQLAWVDRMQAFPDIATPEWTLKAIESTQRVVEAEISRAFTRAKRKVTNGPG